MFSKLSKPQVITLAVFTLFVVAEIILFATGYLELHTPEKVNNQPEENEVVDTSTSTVENGIEEFTEEVDEQETETEAAEVVEVTTNPERDEQLGIYNITVSSDGYSPNRLVITQGTIVSVNLFAEDGDYDFYIPSTGNHLQANEGEEDESSFRMNQAGTYRFECRDLCPSSGKIYGELVVKPKE